MRSIKIMKKHWILFLFLLPVTAAFAQHDLKIDLSYSRMMHKDCLWEYSDFRIGAGYEITDWCVAGVFGSYGRHQGSVRYFAPGSYEIVEYEGNMDERDYHYGVDVELHPLAALFPNFHWVDPYCRGELGLRTITERYTPQYEGYSSEPIHSDFLYGGSLGLAINPIKYIGVFYEYAFDNLNKTVVSNGSSYVYKTKPIHRFGINVRIPIVK